MSYNGWKNYSTWCVVLWLTNEQSLYEDRRGKTAKEIRSIVSDSAEDLMWEGRKLSPFSAMLQNLLSSTLEDVDWKEVEAAVNEE
jgi:hypothetical protein